MGIGFDHLKTVAIAATAAIAAATVALGAKVTSMAAEYEKSMAEVFTDPRRLGGDVRRT